MNPSNSSHWGLELEELTGAFQPKPFHDAMNRAALAGIITRLWFKVSLSLRSAHLNTNVGKSKFIIFLTGSSSPFVDSSIHGIHPWPGMEWVISHGMNGIRLAIS